MNYNLSDDDEEGRERCWGWRNEGAKIDQTKTFDTSKILINESQQKYLYSQQINQKPKKSVSDSLFNLHM